MKTNIKYDWIIIGSGIVGLATALKLRSLYPGTKMLILDKEADVARHQTGRNSGVIHSGIYYKPGSFKARNCVEGYRLLLDYLKARQLPYRLTGKLIVATSESEISRLETLYRNGLANGLRQIRLLEADEIRRYEPHVRGIAALHVPYTGITDYGLVARRMAEELKENGVAFMFNTPVARIGPGSIPEILTSQGTVRARQVIVAAGLPGDRLYGGNEFRVVPFRGEYYNLSSRLAPAVRGLIYPVPDPRYPFLGVHLTRHIDGRVSAGPSAVLAPGREAYEKGQWNRRDVAEILGFPGFWKMAFRHYRMGIHEMWRSWSKKNFLRDVHKFLPQARPEDLRDFHSGIRAQLVDRQGRLVDDFLIRRREHVIYVLNAPSPAATASLAIGKQVAAMTRE